VVAGYIVTMKDEQLLRECIERGAYGTLMNPPDGYWGKHHEGTFADFAGMSPDDDIYFFHRRHVYGIGRLVEINGAVAHGNTPDAHVPQPFVDGDEPILVSNDAGKEIRFFCTFLPTPGFFEEGVDMDDLLDSAPASFRMLRVLQNRSFVKVDDQENQALRDVILRRAFTRSGDLATAPTMPFDGGRFHADASARLGLDHRLAASEILVACANGSAIGHEMALEAGLVQQVARGETTTNAVLGSWDYVTHQVPASPFKPIAYMDFIDVFGYRYLPGHRPTVAQFLVAELKRAEASADDVLQLMKYVDWVKSEYAAGDYGLISAFLIAHSFDEGALAAAASDGERRYIMGRRPAEARTWRDVRLMSYEFGSDGLLRFAEHAA
jgi:hypothetical protein